MRMRIILSFLLLISLPLISAGQLNNDITIINYETHNRYLQWDALYVPPDKIIVNGMNPSYRELLVHEYVHAVCYHKFGDTDREHKRCFTPEYNEGKAIV